ncbi:hypothetical protein OG21DRAFT_1507727 [Imleria badia]|nr:hypothetical protein OG21DRAFT_1507727 [Imleria badia]
MCRKYAGQHGNAARQPGLPYDVFSWISSAAINQLPALDSEDLTHLDLVSLSDDSPPPYPAVLAAPLVKPFEHPETTLPFSKSDIKILALVSEGQTLDSRFKDVRDAVSAGAKFKYQEHALVLCQSFETLVWESRNIAGVALVAIKGDPFFVRYFHEKNYLCF